MRMLFFTLSFLLPALVTAPAAAQGSEGKALYLKHCRSCHGSSGQPTKQALRETPRIPALDAPFLVKRSADSLLAVLRQGVGRDMKSFKSKLSPEEMQAVVTYLRETFAIAKEVPRSP